MSAAPKDAAPVLVVGAGPTGLTLACHLALYGVRARVVERTPARTTESRALGVHARTLEILEPVGVARKLVAGGVATEFLTFRMGDKGLVRLPYKDLDTPYPFMLLLPQFETERILEERFAALGGVVERGVRFAGLRQRADGVDVTLEHDGGEEERASFAYVVGCDGSKSAVREALGVGFRGAQYEEPFVLGDVTLSTPLARNQAYAFASSRGAVAVLPLPDGRFRVIGSAGGLLPQGPPGPLPFEAFRDIIAAIGVLGDTTMRDPLRVARFNVHRRIADRYVDGRVLLAGDAAHIHSPAGGQGMNLGIQDAANLAWKLAAVVRRGAPPALLASYEAERRPVALATISGTNSATKLATLKGAIAVALRDRIMPFVVGRLLGRRTLLGASQLGTAYRSSPIVHDARRAGFLAAFRRGFLGVFLRAFGVRRSFLRAGERAPDAILTASGQGTARLFTAFANDGRPTVLAFAGRSTDAGSVARAASALAAAEGGHGFATRWIVPANGTFAAAEELGIDAMHDPDGRAHARYGAGGGALFVIRPDGYIGFTGALEDTSALLSHLERTLGAPARHASPPSRALAAPEIREAA